MFFCFYGVIRVNADDLGMYINWVLHFLRMTLFWHQRRCNHSTVAHIGFALLAILIAFAFLVHISPTLSAEVDVSPYVGNMWWISESWMSRRGVSGMTPWFEKARELSVKICHVNVILWAGVTYTADENFYCFNSVPMSKTLIRNTVKLAQERGMKVIAYANFWCERSVAYSKYSDSIFRYQGREVTAYKSGTQDTIVMDMDPSKSFGRSMLEQLKGVLDDWWFDGVEYDGLGLETWLNCRDDRGWVNPENPTSLSFGILEFLKQAKAIANVRGKVIMGNSPRSSRVHPFLDLVMNALDNVGDTLSARKVGYNGPWYDFFRDYCGFTFDQLIHTSWEPRGYYPTTLSRGEFITFFQWCLAGDCFMSLRWNDDLQDCYAHKDLFDVYMPYIMDRVLTKLTGGSPGDVPPNPGDQVRGDLSGDGKVNMLDVSIAAIAFGTYTGDPKWNAYADLNFDGFINILDLAIIALEYGKTS